MKILLVGPGLMNIPSKGWGAVETVIWQLKIHLEKNGHTVDILNKKGLIPAMKAKPWNYDLVHLEYDDYTHLWNILAKILKFKLLVTSHYGYAAWPQKWYRGRFGIGGYSKIFRNLIHSPGLIVLSNEIKDIFIKNNYKGFLEVLPNGTEICEIKFSDFPHKEAICLGKIEARKKQAFLSKLVSEAEDLSIDFVGPISDETFSVNNKNTRYLGTWSREDVKNKLTNYKALVLLSEGEAHALVIGEALAAGLSLIISNEASANLDRNQPFIKIIDLKKINQDTLRCIKNTLIDNEKYRHQIREYSKTFDWNNISDMYIKLVEKYLKKTS